jgi:hypothetical protein
LVLVDELLEILTGEHAQITFQVVASTV